MGAPMATNLARAGHRLTLYDIDADAGQRLAAAIDTMEVVTSPKAVAQAAEIVITMLPSGNTRANR